MAKKIVVLYGSESGNAEEFALSLSFKLHRNHFPHHISSFMDFEPKDILGCKYLFVVCSTRGQGDFPKNVSESELWNFLKRADLPYDFLNHLSIGLLGLGDSSYSHFQYAIRKLQRRLVEQLGAKELFPRYETDEIGVKGSGGGSVEAVYFEYEKTVLGILNAKFPTRKINGETVKRQPLDDSVYLAPSISLVKKQLQPDAAVSQKYQDPKSVIKIGRVVKNKRITAEDHFQDVRQFQIGTDDTFEPGDTLGIYPENTDENVEAFLRTQPQWFSIADTELEFNKENLPSHFHFEHILTLRNLLKYYFDFVSIPKRTFFSKIWTFATDGSLLTDGEEQLEQQREKLKEFGFDEEMQELYDYCNRPRRSILEVVADFQSLRLPWEFIFDYLPPIIPRFYSISNSYNGEFVELTVAIVKYRTILHKIREGLCTTYLSGLKEGTDNVRYSIQKNYLLARLSDLNKPVLLISPGVGLAPIKSLISAGHFKARQYVFFGCRLKDKDYIYQEELENWHRQKEIQLFTCFSRDISSSPNVKYVQDVLWEQSELVCRLLKDEGCYVYLCGSSGKMPIQVKLTLLEALKKHGNFENEEAAELYFKKLQKDYRYLQETW